jgi:hypothetical protein
MRRRIVFPLAAGHRRGLLSIDVSRGSIEAVSRARIGIVGEFQPNFAPHTAIDTAIEHALDAEPSRPPIALEWVSTADAEDLSTEELATYAGWWIAPGKMHRRVLSPTSSRLGTGSQNAISSLAKQIAGRAADSWVSCPPDRMPAISSHR